MYSKVLSYTLFGIDVLPVSVEATVSPGLPRFEIIGLPDAAIRESRDRIIQSFVASGYQFPEGAVTVNLAPAEIKKKGAALDLPIALAILSASKKIKPALPLETTLIAGELSLNGKVTEAGGLFNAGVYSVSNNLTHFIYPAACNRALSPFSQFLKIPCGNLREAIELIQGHPFESDCLEEISGEIEAEQRSNATSDFDFSEVVGNEEAKQAILYALLGRLNLLFVGPPGCGKSMLLRRIPTLSLPLEERHAMEVAAIHAIGNRGFHKIPTEAPFREIHHTITEPALVGGGEIPRPGEISMAHRGVLFIDELAEFSRSAIQLLRVPIEEKRVTVHRQKYSYTFPSDFMLVAASNPCGCGYYGDESKMCICSAAQRASFYSRLSGPVIDRFDIIVYLNRPKEKHLFTKSSYDTAQMSQMLRAPRERMAANPQWSNSANISEVFEKNKNLVEIIKRSYKQGYISLRRVSSIMKLATVISIFHNEPIDENILYEAIQLGRFKWSS